jgi:hypothetical protein
MLRGERECGEKTEKREDLTDHILVIKRPILISIDSS